MRYYVKGSRSKGGRCWSIVPLPDTDSIQPTCVLCNCIYRENVFLRKCVKHQKKKKKGRERKGKKFSPQPINKVSRFLNAIRPFRSLYFSKGNETFPPFLPPVFRGITISGPRFGTKDSSARSSLSTSLLLHSIR